MSLGSNLESTFQKYWIIFYIKILKSQNLPFWNDCIMCFFIIDTKYMILYQKCQLQFWFMWNLIYFYHKISKTLSIIYEDWFSHIFLWYFLSNHLFFSSYLILCKIVNIVIKVTCLCISILKFMCIMWNKHSSVCCTVDICWSKLFAFVKCINFQ